MMTKRFAFLEEENEPCSTETIVTPKKDTEIIPPFNHDVYSSIATRSMGGLTFKEDIVLMRREISNLLVILGSKEFMHKVTKQKLLQMMIQHLDLWRRVNALNDEIDNAPSLDRRKAVKYSLLELKNEHEILFAQVHTSLPENVALREGSAR